MNFLKKALIATCIFLVPMALYSQEETIEQVGHIGGYADRFAVYGEHAYVPRGNYITILDISGTDLQQTGQFRFSDWLYDLQATGNHLFFALGSAGIRLIDISDPSNPSEKATVQIPEGYVHKLHLSGNHVYAAAGNAGLKVVDVTDPSSPEIIGTAAIENAVRVFTLGNYAYIINSTTQVKELYVIDISNPANPETKGSCTINGYQNVSVFGQYAYISHGYEGGLQIVDVSNPENPAVISSYGEGSMKAHDVAVYLNYAYVACSSDGLTLLDVSDPENPTEIKTFTDIKAGKIQIDHPKGYVIHYNDYGFRVLDFSDLTNPEVDMQQEEPSDIPTIFASENTLFIGSRERLFIYDLLATPATPSLLGSYTTWQPTGIFARDSYAYILTSDNFYILNISDKNSPYQEGVLAQGSMIGRVFVEGDYAYVVTNNEMWVIDISQPANPQKVGELDIKGQGEIYIPQGSQTGYVADQNGLNSVDLSTPSSPQILKTVSTDRYAKCVWVSHDTAYVGCSSQRKFYIIAYDVSIPSDPVVLSRTAEESGNIKDIKVHNGTVFAGISEYSGVYTYILEGYYFKPGPKCEGSAQQFATYSPNSAETYIYSCAESNGGDIQKYRKGEPEPNPILLLSEGPSNPEYTAQCPPLKETEKSNTPIIQIKLTANPDDSWIVNTVKFETYGEGNESWAVHYEGVKLHFGDEDGTVLDSTSFTMNNGSVSLNVGQTVPAGQSITLMLTYDFISVGGGVGDFYGWTNILKISAKPLTYKSGKMEPQPPPNDPPATVTGGPTVLGNVHNINTARCYYTIQDAVNAKETKDGHTIRVCPGNHSENVDVTKSLTIESIKGASFTTINADLTDRHIFTIKKDSTKIKGFQIKGTKLDVSAGIFIEGESENPVNDVIITENIIKNNHYGILLIDNVRYCQVYDNIVCDSYEGISLQNGPEFNIIGKRSLREGNYIADNTYGISLFNVSNNQICGNDIGFMASEDGYSNTVGIRMHGSNQNFIELNIIGQNRNHGIHIAYSDSNQINSNYIGTDGHGKIEPNGENGILLCHANHNTIGDSLSTENVISGNKKHGIAISEKASQNIILKNKISQNDGYGIFITNKELITVQGGLTSEDDENYAEGDGHRIKIQEQNIVEKTKILNNKIEENFDGIVLEGEGTRECEVVDNVILNNKVNGISIKNGATLNQIGDFQSGKKRYNIISGNKDYGIYISKSDTNIIEYNYIGLDENKEYALGNGSGIKIDQGNKNWIHNNAISGNRYDGIELVDSKHNKIQGNTIGIYTLLKLNESLQNGRNGIYLINSWYNIIGGIPPDGNEISGNKAFGILLYKSCGYNQIMGNCIGTILEGVITIPNGESGIGLQDGPSFNKIGDELGQSPNIISGNMGSGISLTGENTWTNTIQHNFIGIDTTGLIRPNQMHGIRIYEAGKNRIQHNTISGNKLDGINIWQSDENRIAHNRIGTSVDGKSAVPNRVGINLYFTKKDTIEKNCISGNSSHGIDTEGSYSVIADNMIGIDIEGKKALPNQINGINLEYEYDSIIRSNTISGNKNDGLYLKKCRKCIIKQNLIGTNGDGDLPIPNLAGIHLYNSKSNVIGGFNKGERNVISGNLESGLVLDHSSYNKIVYNYIGCCINGYYEVKNNKYGIEMRAQSDWNVMSANRIMNHPMAGLYMYQSESNQLMNNTFAYNCPAVKILDCYTYGLEGRNLVMGNTLYRNTCNTGFNINHSYVEITGNIIRDDEHDGIKCENGSEAVISRNNITGNQGYGLVNTDASVTIQAQGNWWGDAGGPGGEGSGSGDAVQGSIDYSNWCEEPVDVVVSSPGDTILMIPGTEDSITVFFQNLENPDDILDVTVTDPKSWFQGQYTFTVNLEDSMGAMSLLKFLTPGVTQDNQYDTITVTATSQTDPNASAVDSFVISLYTQQLASISVLPDSATINPGDTLKFTAYCYDQIDNPISYEPIWDATGGTISATGMYTAGSNIGEFSVTVSDSLGSIEAQAVVIIVTEETSVEERSEFRPTKFYLYQNFPNPFNPLTTIWFDVKERSHVILKIYDMLGREMMTLVDSEYDQGRYNVRFDASQFSTGLYFYMIEMEDFHSIKKMMLLK